MQFAIDSSEIYILPVQRGFPRPACHWHCQHFSVQFLHCYLAAHIVFGATKILSMEFFLKIKHS